jgi:hypothetical protein
LPTVCLRSLCHMGTAFRTAFRTALRTALRTAFRTALRTAFRTALRTAFRTAFRTPPPTVLEPCCTPPVSQGIPGICNGQQELRGAGWEVCVVSEYGCARPVPRVKGNRFFHRESPTYGGFCEVAAQSRTVASGPLRDVDDLSDDDRKILVQCSTGVGRTGVFLTCWLHRKLHKDESRQGLK